MTLPRTYYTYFGSTNHCMLEHSVPVPLSLAQWTCEWSYPRQWTQWSTCSSFDNLGALPKLHTPDQCNWVVVANGTLSPDTQEVLLRLSLTPPFSSNPILDWYIFKTPYRYSILNYYQYAYTVKDKDRPISFVILSAKEFCNFIKVGFPLFSFNC